MPKQDLKRLTVDSKFSPYTKGKFKRWLKIGDTTQFGANCDYTCVGYINSTIYAAVKYSDSTAKLFRCDNVSAKSWTQIGGTLSNTTIIGKFVLHNGYPYFYTADKTVTGSFKVWYINGNSLVEDSPTSKTNESFGETGNMIAVDPSGNLYIFWKKFSDDTKAVCKKSAGVWSSIYSSLSVNTAGSIAVTSSYIYLGYGNPSANSKGKRLGLDGSGAIDYGTGGALTNKEMISDIIYMNNLLYFGCGTGSGDGDIIKFDGTTLTQIGGDGTPFTASNIQSFAQCGSQLLATNQSSDSVYYWNESLLSWETQTTEWSASYNYNVVIKESELFMVGTHTPAEVWWRG